jgi:hypothetical protein
VVAVEASQVVEEMAAVVAAVAVATEDTGAASVAEGNTGEIVV